MPSLQRTIRILLIIAVTLIAVLLRLRAVELLPIDYDEDDYLRAAQQYATAIQAGHWSDIPQLNYRTEHPPLTKLLNGIAIAPLPPAPEIPDLPITAPPAKSLPEPHLTIARLVTALWGTLQVFALALMNPLAALFLAVDTWQIKYTSQVMLEALPALTSLVTMMAYVKSRGKWNRWLVLSAFALGLTAASKYVYCLIAVAISVDWILNWRHDQSKRDSRSFTTFAPMIAWGVIAFAVFFVADPYLWSDPINRLKESVLYHVGYAQSEGVKQANLPMWQPLVWLLESVPWHPGVFMISIDLVTTILALVGLPRLWRKQRAYALWLIIAFVFLLIWTTKWSQYILILTAPLMLAATEGFAAWIGEPIHRWYQRARANRFRIARPRLEWGDLRHALPWLAPGLITLGVITMFPLVFQSAMALTDFNGMSIRDGITGGVWREVWLGMTGQVKPVLMQMGERGRAVVQVEIQDRGETRAVAITDPASPLSPKQVHYAGPAMFTNFIATFGADLIVFEILWTTLALGSQTLLGLGLALMLQRQGIRFRGGWRAIYILPWAIPEFVGTLIWLHVFEPENGWLALALGTKIPWANDPMLALGVMLISALWLGFPFMLIAASAGLKSIPPEVYDAASVDGATGWSLFRNVTLPLLMPLLAPAMILRGIFTFNQFYLFYVMRPPFPLYTFATLSFYLFNTNGYFGGQFAISAVVNLLTVAWLVILITWFNRRTRAAEGVTYA